MRGGRFEPTGRSPRSAPQEEQEEKEEGGRQGQAANKAQAAEAPTYDMEVVMKAQRERLAVEPTRL